MVSMQRLQTDSRPFSLTKYFLNMFVRDVLTQMILLKILANKISTTESRIESLIGKDARSRIIAFLKQNIISTGKKIECYTEKCNAVFFI